MSFEIIKMNYDKKLWNQLMVAKAVEKKVITPEQYKEIVEEDYVETT